MPMMQGFLRRRGASSDADIRRHSFLSPETASNPPILDGRASEQIPRRPSAAEFLSPSSATDPPSITRTSADRVTELGERSVSPPVQDESNKHRRFSMLKFRHASDSQLSTRARLQAQTAAPPVPQREYLSYPTCVIMLTRIFQPPRLLPLLQPWI
jgi:hypothetical protein